MPLSDTCAVLDAFLSARSTKDVQTILTALGDHPQAALDEPFGPHQFQWHAFGNNASNLSTIGLGTKPGRSLTERITNAVDAVLEDRLPPGIIPPPSPRAAAQSWFGRPISGPDDGLFKWDYSEYGIDRRIAVVLSQGGDESDYIVDVVDDGTGIAPDDFASTILSLQSGNKIRKWYLIGAFGQGGAATLAFCDFALIVSKARASHRTGFTVVRVLNLNETYKEDSYAYLAVASDSGLTVPSCESTEALSLYQNELGARLPVLSHGTLVRHFGYRLANLDKSFQASPGNLYHFLHFSMFDPLTPFRIFDLRDPKRPKDEVVTGSRNRLMKLAMKMGVDSEVEHGSEVRHYREMEFVVPQGATEPCVGIEYWVVLNYRKRKDQMMLRPHSNELFVQTNYPIVGTLNGQNQGELSSQLLREIGLNLLARHVVIHLDATKVDRRVRRELFSTNREGFKDGPVLTSLTRVLRRMLEEDAKLYEIERELAESAAQREAQTTSDEVKRQVSRLLLEAGFRISGEGPTFGAGTQLPQPVRPSRPHKPIVPSPLPTLPFPEVTRFEIVVPKDKLEIHLNDVEVVLVETDADAEFDRRNLVAIRSEPALLEVASKTPLRGGRVRWRLRPTNEAKVGVTGRIIATITRLDGSQIVNSKPFEVHAAVEEPADKIKGYVPDFEIVPINPDDNPDKWGIAWPDLSDGETEEQLGAVAYKPVRAGGKLIVYYSTIFVPYRNQVVKLTNESKALLELFKSQYEVWIGYHAILQESSRTDDKEGLDPSALDRIWEAERARVAQMQVKQVRTMAEFMRRASREEAAAAGDS